PAGSARAPARGSARVGPPRRRSPRRCWSRDWTPSGSAHPSRCEQLSVIQLVRRRSARRDRTVPGRYANVPDLGDKPLLNGSDAFLSGLVPPIRTAHATLCAAYGLTAL